MLMDLYGNTKNKITKLNIFDLDGTLIKSPLPEFGKTEYEKRTGVVWPYKGWWSKKESLDMDIFEIPMVEETYKAYKKDSGDPNIMNVMVTGRMFKLGPYVEKILKANKLFFDKHFYNRGGSTFDAKIKQFDDLVAQLPDLEILEMWDDRDEHMEGFLEWGKKQKIKFIYNKID